MSYFRTCLLAAALLAASPQARAESPHGLVDVLHKFVQAVAGADADAFARLFTPDPSITDTVFPFHWQGTDAARNYLSDLRREVKADGYENLTLTYDHDPFLVSRAGFAYAAVHLFVTYKRHGEAHSDRGTFTLSLRQDGQDWRIASATWSYSRPPGEEK